MYRPLHVTERFPEAHVRRIDWCAARSLISREEILARAKTANWVAAAEAPGPDAEPAEIHHGIAELGQFPVEHAANAAFVHDQIPHPEVAVDHCMTRPLRQMFRQPAKA